MKYFVLFQASHYETIAQWAVEYHDQRKAVPPCFLLLPHRTLCQIEAMVAPGMLVELNIERRKRVLLCVLGYNNGERDSYNW